MSWKKYRKIKDNIKFVNCVSLVDNVLHENECRDVFTSRVKYETTKDEVLQFNCPDCNKFIIF